MKSLDPRINRLDITDAASEKVLTKHEHWQTYEVFVQKRRGAQHQHEGSLHAATDDMALMLAKEQYGRRNAIFNIWVVKSSHIIALDTSDADMFANNRQKKYRNSNGFKVSDKITAYKKSQTKK